MVNILNDKSNGAQAESILVNVTLPNGITDFPSNELGLSDKSGTFFFSAVGNSAKFLSFVVVMHNGSFVAALSLFELQLSATVHLGNLRIDNPQASLDVVFSITEM